MLSCCDADGEILSVPEFFAVGKTFRALFWCAVKGGGHCQFLNISVIYKVHLRRVPRPSVFINHLTLPFKRSVKSDTPFFIKNLVFSGITPLLKIKKQ